MLNNPEVCPRCTFPMDREIAALCRIDDKTEVCSVCGEEEAAEWHAIKYVTPKSEWPVKRRGRRPVSA